MASVLKQNLGANGLVLSLVPVTFISHAPKKWDHEDIGSIRLLPRWFCIWRIN
jgi:hypothetical protein